jgi:(p)ppGpp synthase/HD superfamily hydrolase
MSKLERAILLAVEAHSGHWRKGPSPLPYIAHPIEVLAKVRHWAGVTDEDVLAAAVLHDTVEDTDVTLQQLQEAFGPRVARIVGELTRENQANLLDEIAHMSPESQTIKLADRHSNLWESERTREPDRVRAYAAEAVRMLAIIPRELAPELWDSLHLLAHRLCD